MLLQQAFGSFWRWKWHWISKSKRAPPTFRNPVPLPWSAAGIFPGGALPERGMPTILRRALPTFRNPVPLSAIFISIQPIWRAMRPAQPMSHSSPTPECW